MIGGRPWGGEGRGGKLGEGETLWEGGGLGGALDVSVDSLEEVCVCVFVCACTVVRVWYSGSACSFSPRRLTRSLLPHSSSLLPARSHLVG